MRGPEQSVQLIHSGIVARNDLLAAVASLVIGAIRRLLATAQAVETLIGLDKLDKVIVALARGTLWMTGIVLSTPIVLVDPELSRVDPTGHLDILDSVSADSFEVLRENEAVR